MYHLQGQAADGRRCPPRGTRGGVRGGGERLRGQCTAAGVVLGKEWQEAAAPQELRRNVTVDQKLYLRCGLLDAPAWIFPERARALVASAVDKSARFAPAFAAQGARSGDF